MKRTKRFSMIFLVAVCAFFGAARMSFAEETKAPAAPSQNSTPTTPPHKLHKKMGVKRGEEGKKAGHKKHHHEG